VNREDQKRRAADAAADDVRDGMRVGLGTGSTVAYLLAALARRRPRADYVATSPRTAEAARAHGLEVGSFDSLEWLDLAIDGADQVAPDGWLVKGAGGAHTREKLVAAAAERFVVIVDESKLVDAIAAPIPLELVSFGLASTLTRLESVALRVAPASPDQGRLADFFGEVQDPAELARHLDETPGVIEHGLFAPSMVSEVLVGRPEGVERRVIGAMT
jgi:ribose 5-phosphate isomerase A